MNNERKPYDKFKRFLAINNIKQKELAEKLGKSESFINNALNRRGAKFTPEDFRGINRLFNIRISDYF